MAAKTYCTPTMKDADIAVANAYPRSVPVPKGRAFQERSAVKIRNRHDSPLSQHDVYSFHELDHLKFVSVLPRVGEERRGGVRICTRGSLFNGGVDGRPGQALILPLKL